MKANKLILARPPCRKTFTLHWDVHTTHIVVVMTKKSDIFYSLGHFHDISVTSYVTVNATLPPALSLPPISLSLFFPSPLLSLSLRLTSLFSHSVFFSFSSISPLSLYFFPSLSLYFPRLGLLLSVLSRSGKHYRDRVCHDFLCLTI